MQPKPVPGAARGRGEESQDGSAGRFARQNYDARSDEKTNPQRVPHSSFYCREMLKIQKVLYTHDVTSILKAALTCAFKCTASSAFMAAKVT